MFPFQQIERIDSDWKLDRDPNVTLHPHNGLGNKLLYNLVAFINSKEGMYFKQLDTPILLISRVFVEREKNTISFQALFLFHRVVWAGWSMLMLAYNAHCMLIQCSQKVFIKFASRRYDDTSPSDADVHLRF